MTSVPAFSTLASDADLDRLERGRVQLARQVGFRDADEDARRHAFEARQHALAAHARVDQHRNGAELPQAPDDGDQVGPRLHEHAGAVAGFHTQFDQPAGQSTGARVQLRIRGDVEPLGARHDHGGAVRRLPSMQHQSPRDVDAFGQDAEGCVRVRHVRPAPSRVRGTRRHPSCGRSGAVGRGTVRAHPRRRGARHPRTCAPGHAGSVRGIHAGTRA